LFACSSKTIKIFPTDEFTKTWQSQYEATLAEIESSRRLWRENKIESYDFETYYIGGGIGYSTGSSVKVRNGQLFSMEKFPDEFASKEFYAAEKMENIEKAFDFLAQELEKGRVIEAEYNQKFGYPEKVVIRYSFNIDASGVFGINKFEIIK
jgi:hypothetical protein